MALDRYNRAETLMVFGSFNPPTWIHRLAPQAIAESAGLSQIVYVPCAYPVHKAGLMPFEARCEMLSLALLGLPNTVIDPIEAELPEPSYTVQTLSALFPESLESKIPFFIGWDALSALATWHQPDELVSRVHFYALCRTGVDWLTLEAQLQHQWPEITVTPVERTFLHPQTQQPLVNLSASAVRAALEAGESDLSAWTPTQVEHYLLQHRALVRSA